MASAYSAPQSARARFFAIHELVLHFLLQADTAVMVNCQRVCRLWNDMIEKEEALQEILFLLPSSHTQAATTVKLNEILFTHFRPLLGPCTTHKISQDQHILQTSTARYEDLIKLSWARDGTSLDSRSRKAFSRREASWRRMLVSQPPIRQLDWWHQWECEARMTEQAYAHLPKVQGTGHEYNYKDNVTIGVLWDLIESRLLRECTTTLSFFVAGGSTLRDPAAFSKEKAMESIPRLAARPRNVGLSIASPRVILRSTQVWPNEGPAFYNQRFNVQSRTWEIESQLPGGPATKEQERRYEVYDGNGYSWLSHDCTLDEQDTNWRWSRSDAYQKSELKCLSSGWGPPPTS